MKCQLFWLHCDISRTVVNLFSDVVNFFGDVVNFLSHTVEMHLDSEQNNIKSQLHGQAFFSIVFSFRVMF